MSKEKKQRKILSVPLHVAIYTSVVAACILIDQLAKYYIEIAVRAHGGRIRILGNWLTLTWTINYGVTGGLLSNVHNAHWIVFAMTLIGLPIFGWLLWRSRTRSVCGQIAFSFIIGGTVGNALDRIIFAENGFFTGGVRDFIQVEGFFGIFNTADSFLVVGVFLALFAIVFFDPDSLLRVLLEERAQKKASARSDGAETDTAAEGSENDAAEEAKSDDLSVERSDENVLQSEQTECEDEKD